VETASRTEVTERVGVELPLEPESAARARAALAPLRPHTDASSFDDVRLLVSELVADAVATRPRLDDGSIHVEAVAQNGVTLVELRFDGVTLKIPARKPKPAEPGWAVYLVQTLADRWGAKREGGSVYLWFEA
jgi:hypothetical protein